MQIYMYIPSGQRVKDAFLGNLASSSFANNRCSFLPEKNFIGRIPLSLFH